MKRNLLSTLVSSKLTMETPYSGRAARAPASRSGRTLPGLKSFEHDGDLVAHPTLTMSLFQDYRGEHTYRLVDVAVDNNILIVAERFDLALGDREPAPDRFLLVEVALEQPLAQLLVG